MSFIEIKPGDWIDSQAVDRVVAIMSLDEMTETGVTHKQTGAMLWLSCGAKVEVRGDIETILETIKEANKLEYPAEEEAQPGARPMSDLYDAKASGDYTNIREAIVNARAYGIMWSTIAEVLGTTVPVLVSAYRLGDVN